MEEGILMELKRRLSMALSNLYSFTLENISEFVDWCRDFNDYIMQVAGRNMEMEMLAAALRNTGKDLPHLSREAQEGTKYTEQYLLDWRRDSVRNQIYRVIESLPD